MGDTWYRAATREGIKNDTRHGVTSFALAGGLPADCVVDGLGDLVPARAVGPLLATEALTTECGHSLSNCNSGDIEHTSIGSPADSTASDV